MSGAASAIDRFETELDFLRYLRNTYFMHGDYRQRSTASEEADKSQ